MADRLDVSTRWLRSVEGIPLLAGIALVCSSCLLGPPVYFAKPIEGRVVDAGTHEPIEGAVVVAAWKTWMLSVDTTSGPTLNVKEAVTDSEGRYRIPGWGPRPRVPLTGPGGRDPVLTVFKSGYVPRALYNNELYRSDYSPVRYSDWDGKTIELKRFEGDSQQRSIQLLSTLRNAGGSWPARSTPQLLGELLQDEKMFDRWAGRGELFFENLREMLRNVGERWE